MSIAEKLTEVAENVPKVYEAGKKAERDSFWEAFQRGGIAMSYTQAFFSNKWDDTNYKPKYPLICTSCASMYNSSNITDTIQYIDVSACSNTQYLFGYASLLKTIRKLILAESVKFDGTFASTANLENLTIEGKIGQNGFNVQWSKKLNGESIVSIIEALSATTDELNEPTITLSQTAVKNIDFPITSKQTKVTYDSWENLIATKSNWTISLV